MIVSILYLLLQRCRTINPPLRLERQAQSCPSADTLALSSLHHGKLSLGLLPWSNKTISHQPRRAIILCVEGNIGSGKSTLLEGLRKNGFPVFPEPVEDEWKIPLQRFYSDPARWAFSFQIEVLKWFRKLRDTALWTPCHDTPLIARNTYSAHPPSGFVTQQTPSDWIKIVERSPNVGFWVFSQNLHHQGNLSDKELLLLKDLVSEWGWEPDYTIYVRTPAKEAWERLSKQGRSCEESGPPTTT